MHLHERASNRGRFRVRRLFAVPALLLGTLAITPEAAHATGPSVPVLITPSSGASIKSGPGQLFTVRATDPNGDPYAATIELSNGAMFTTTVVPSDQDATGTPATSLSAGNWMWRARSTTREDTSTNPPGATVVEVSSAWSAWQAFTVVDSGPSVPVLVSPTVDGGVNGGPGQLFTVRSTDPDDDPYHATIEVSGGTLTPVFTTQVVPSGQEATGTPPLPVRPGTSWSWRAQATSVSASGVLLNSGWSAWQAFTVSSPPTFGTGVVTGQTTFTTALPGALMPCAATNFTFDSTLAPNTVGEVTDDANAGAVLNIQGHAFAGKITLAGTGTGACANASAGSGTLSVTGTGFDPKVGSLSCSLSGYFVRLVSYTSLSLGGTCGIGGTTTAPVNFRAEVLFRPDQGAGDGQILGVDQSVTHALFAGDFTVTPA